MAKLTEKQKRFVAEYLVDLNATQAAIRAGYSPKTANRIGSQNLSKVDVQAEIEKRRATLRNKLEITQEKVIEELAAVAFANGADFAQVTKTGLVRIIPTEDIPQDKRKAIASIKEGANGTEIKTYDKVRALELLGLWGRANGKWYRMCEYYFDSRKEGRQRTDEEHYTELEKLADGLHISAVIVDPSAASFIEVIRRHGRFRVEKASNAVIDGIRNVATRLQCGDIFICDCCTDCIREFGMYRWDEKALMDKPIKENDHSMDDVRYFVHKVFAPELFSFK